MKKNKQEIIKAIKSTWSSLESHLPYCEKLTPQERKMCGSEKFHITTIRGYAETIKTLADLL